MAQEAGVSQYRVRKETGGRAELFASVMAEKVSSAAASQIAHAVEAPNETPPLAAIVAAGAAVFASPERSWDLLELEALTRSHRDAQLREIETERIQARWNNMRTVVEAVRKLKPGEVSAPLKFEVGSAPIYVIVSPEATRPQGYAAVNDPEVMSEIETKVRSIGMKLAIQRWLDDLRAKHYVQVR